MTQPEGTYADEAPILTHDLFPATVTTATGRVMSQVRVFVDTLDRVWVYGSQGGAPLLLDSYRAERIVAAPGVVEATLADGSQVTYRKEGGCGCSNPLKRWPGPWTPMRMGS